MQPHTLRWRARFLAELANPLFVEALFDRLPDIVFSVKDEAGRYVAISKACVERCGLRAREDAIGKTAFDLFPEHMAERYKRQDEALFRSGRPIVDNLDVTLYPGRKSGWCLTSKEPLRNRAGRVVGLACLSKDLLEPSCAGLIDAGFADAIDYIHENHTQALRVDSIARRAKLSVAQFERRMKKIFHISAGQYLIKTRIDTASRLLAESDIAIAQVAQQCGFSDQSALSRQFRQLMGLAPRHYRQLMQGPGADQGNLP